MLHVNRNIIVEWAMFKFIGVFFHILRIIFDLRGVAHLWCLRTEDCASFIFDRSDSFGDQVWLGPVA